MRSRISIHAPSRERRLLFDHFQAMCGISIHAPSRERHNLPLCCSLPPRFQSTLPRGSDCQRRYFPDIARISIHAPSRERPLRSGRLVNHNLISIHAPSRERLAWAHGMQSGCLFQSTLPRGSDPVCSSKSQISTNFNPRSLAGATFDFCSDF